MDMCARARTGPFCCVRPVYVCCQVWMCVHVRVSGRLVVHALCYSATFLCVLQEHVRVRVWTLVHVLVLAFFYVYATFTCIRVWNWCYVFARFFWVRVWTCVLVPVPAFRCVRPEHV